MHGLEIGSNGRAAFAGRGEPAWHNLGTVFGEDDAVDTAEMLRLAHLDKWNLRLSPVAVQGQEDVKFVTPAFAVLRDNPFESDQVDALSIVGKRYTIVQNEELFSFGDALLDGGGQWETAGSIKDGRVVFGSLLLPKEIVIDGEGANDKVKIYLLVNTSHDGTVGVQASTTPVRVVCQNTLNYALQGVKQTFKVRHTQKVAGKVQAAREALAISFAHADAFEKEASALYQTSMTNAEFQKVVSTIYPKPADENKAGLTRWENKVELLGDIFAGTVENGPSTNTNITGTAWAGLNALTERIDWYRSPRDGDLQALYEAASGFNAVVNGAKADIHKTVLAWAKEKNAPAFA